MISYITMCVTGIGDRIFPTELIFCMDTFPSLWEENAKEGSSAKDEQFYFIIASLATSVFIDGRIFTC